MEIGTGLTVTLIVGASVQLLGAIVTTIGFVVKSKEEDQITEEVDSWYPVPTMYEEFSSGDDELCKTNFRHTEQIYADQYDGYVLNEQTFTFLYQDILNFMEFHDVALVDNQEFLTWASTSGGSVAPLSVTIPSHIEQEFLSSEGAEPFTSEE